MTTKTWDAGQLSIAFGPDLLSGLGEDSVVKVTRDEQSFIKHTGADGETTRSRNRNKGGTVTVTLMRGSASNDILSAALAEDEQFGTGVRPLTIKNLLGTTLHFAASAWIQKAPDDDMMKESNEIEWVFDCADLEYFAGGLVVSGP